MSRQNICLSSVFWFGKTGRSEAGVLVFLEKIRMSVLVSRPRCEYNIFGMKKNFFNVFFEHFVAW